MTNLHTDEMDFSCSLTKIGIDENKAIYSISQVFSYHVQLMVDPFTLFG